MNDIRNTPPASPQIQVPSPERARLAETARRFEAIFVRQILATARQSGFGDPIFGSGASDTFRQMQDERFADIAADRGMLGLAQAIERQLAASLPQGGH